MTRYAGLFHVLATPFDAANRIDVPSLRRLVTWALDAGASGLVALGVMGESAHLDDDERALVMQVVVAEVAGAVPVVVGVSHPASSIAAERARRARDLGAGPLMVAIPPNADRLVEHLTTVADAVPDADLVLQDYPALGHPHVPAEDLSAAARAVPAVAAIKAEDPPTAVKVAGIHERLPELPQLGGLGGLWSLWELQAGATGCMTGFAIPELLVELSDAASREDWDAAHDLYRRALPALVWEAQPGVEIGLRKAMLHARGVIATTALRAPAPSVAGAATAARRLLDDLGYRSPAGSTR